MLLTSVASAHSPPRMSTANTPLENPFTRSGLGLRNTAYLFLRIEAQLHRWQ
jgi:hypothetical protein